MSGWKKFDWATVPKEVDILVSNNNGQCAVVVAYDHGAFLRGGICAVRGAIRFANPVFWKHLEPIPVEQEEEWSECEKIRWRARNGNYAQAPWESDRAYGLMRTGYQEEDMDL